MTIRSPTRGYSSSARGSEAGWRATRKREPRSRGASSCSRRSTAPKASGSGPGCSLGTRSSARRRAAISWQLHGASGRSRPRRSLATRAPSRTCTRCSDGRRWNSVTSRAATACAASLDLYEQVEDLPGQASVLNLLGGFAYWRGEWDAALLRYEQARTLAGQTGNTVLGAFCMTNIGEIALDRGEPEPATTLLEDAARIWRVAGDRPASAFAKLLLGRARSLSGDHAEGLRLLAEARVASIEVGAHIDALEAAARIAESHLAAGDAGRALACVEDALREAQTLGGVAAQLPLLLRVRGLALALCGRADAEARTALEASLEAGRSRHASVRDRADVGRARPAHGRRRGRGAPDGGQGDPGPPRCALGPLPRGRPELIVRSPSSAPNDQPQPITGTSGRRGRTPATWSPALRCCSRGCRRTRCTKSHRPGSWPR